jgi:hypothetical protein
MSRMCQATDGGLGRRLCRHHRPAKAGSSEIPTFVMLRRMILVAWIGSHSETDLAQSMGIALYRIDLRALRGS